MLLGLLCPPPVPEFPELLAFAACPAAEFGLSVDTDGAAAGLRTACSAPRTYDRYDPMVLRAAERSDPREASSCCDANSSSCSLRLCGSSSSSSAAKPLGLACCAAAADEGPLAYPPALPPPPAAAAALPDPELQGPPVNNDGVACGIRAPGPVCRSPPSKPMLRAGAGLRCGDM